MRFIAVPTDNGRPSFLSLRCARRFTAMAHLQLPLDASRERQEKEREAEIVREKREEDKPLRKARAIREQLMGSLTVERERTAPFS